VRFGIVGGDELTRWDDDQATTLEGAARFEQFMLWGDLASAVRETIGAGNWSMRCEGLADRIVMLAKFVGPVPWEHIQIPFLKSGVYERVLGNAGLEYPAIDWDRVNRADQTWRSGT
jgi:hypothetical protein